MSHGAIDTEYWLNNPRPSNTAQGCNECRQQKHDPVEHLQLVIAWSTSRLNWGMAL